jgi:pimeloyl-ACP methyl ester carboxylesterase
MLKEPQLDNSVAWKQRFRAPVIASTRIARLAPTRGLVMSNRSGIYQLYAWDVPTGELRQLTDRFEGLLYGVISPNGRHVYYFADTKGNEIGHFFRIPFDGGEAENITPDMPPYPTFGLGLSGEGNLLAFTTAIGNEYQVYAVDIGPSDALARPRLICRSENLILPPRLSYDGRISVAALSRGSKLLFGLLALDTTTGKHLGELSEETESRVDAKCFAPVAGDFRVACSTNRSGLQRPLIWNPSTGARVDLRVHDLEGEITPCDWSADGQQLLLWQVYQAVERFYLYDIASGAFAELQSPSGAYNRVYFGPNDEIFAEWQDSRRPQRLIALGNKCASQCRVVLSAGEVPQNRPWRSVMFTSSDGQEIQGWLGLPDGDGPLPTILHMHGGPEDVMTEIFSPMSQCWLDHGFAYLTINYRGSTTFGREYLEKIWGNVGYWEVADMVAARTWLVSQGIAKPDEVFLTGWSYGGYLTLQGLGTHPELWAGGMAGIAVADWAMAHMDTTDTLRSVRALRFGGTPEEKPERYAASSPITYAEQVKAPVLIIQGRNDTRTPPRSIEMFEAKMKSLGKDVEVHWFDAGHGSFSVEQNIQFQELMLRFAYRILRSQGFVTGRNHAFRR